jgi:hypothetical protein
LPITFVVLHASVAQNVGIGVTTPGAKLDVGGNIKITDGTQGAGKILTSDNNGLASWQTRKRTRVIREVDPNTGCGVIHTPIYNHSFTLADSAGYTITGKSIRLGSGRHDLNLLVDGTLVQIIIAYTSPADGSQWAEAAFSYGGSIPEGNHTVQVVPANNLVAWGCGNLYGNMIITLFE